MQGKPSKRGAAALPVIIVLALIGGGLGYMYAGGIQPEIATALIVAIVLGVLGAILTKEAPQAAAAEPAGPPPAVDADALAAAFQSSLDSVLSSAQGQLSQTTAEMQKAVGALNQELQANSAKLSDSLTATAGAFNIDTAGIANAMGSVSTDLGQALSGSTAEMSNNLKGLLDGHIAELKNTLAAHSSSLQTSVSELDGSYAKVNEAAASQIQQVNEATASQLQQVSSELGARLDKITAIAGDIDSLLKSTEATNAAVQAMNSSENFRKTMDAIKDQMEQSVAALQEATKPRTFRFMDGFEAEAEEAQQG